MLPLLVTLSFFAFLHVRFASASKIRNGRLTAAGAAWRPYAVKSWLHIFCGAGLLLLGASLGIAAISIPWGITARIYFISLTISISILSLTAQVCMSTNPDCLTISLDLLVPIASPELMNAFHVLRASAYAIGAALVLLVLPATALSGWAAYRLLALAVTGVTPPSGSFCVPSLAAVLGLAWTGWALACAFTALAWALSQLLAAGVTEFLATYLSSEALTVTRAPNDGGAVLIAAMLLIFFGCALLSFSTCCRIGNLPGIGRSRASIFYVDGDATALPAASESAWSLAAAVSYLNPASRSVDTDEPEERVVIPVRRAGAGAKVPSRVKMQAKRQR